VELYFIYYNFSECFSVSAVFPQSLFQVSRSKILGNKPCISLTIQRLDNIIVNKQLHRSKLQHEQIDDVEPPAGPLCKGFVGHCTSGHLFNPPLLVFETGASPLPVFPHATLVFLFMTPSLTFSYFKQRLKHIYSFEWDIHIVIFKLLCVVENFVYVCSKLFEILWNVNSVLIYFCLFVVYSCFLQSVNNVYEFLKAASAVGSFGISDSLPSLLVSNVFSCCSFYLAKRCLLASATQ